MCAACATPGSRGELASLIEAPEARVMFVGAHPDDESVAGAILARACIGLRRPCRFVILTHGDGGACEDPRGCWPSLEARRVAEMAASARAFQASLALFAYPNAKLPWERFPPREEIARQWAALGDPAARVAAEVARFRPTVVLTFDPDHGFTGHPEHQLAGRYALQAVQRTGGAALFEVLNHFWLTRLLGRADPGAPTEWFDTHAACGAPARTCLDVALSLTHLHASQARTMSLVRSLRPQMGWLPVRRPPEVPRAPALLDPALEARPGIRPIDRAVALPPAPRETGADRVSVHPTAR